MKVPSRTIAVIAATLAFWVAPVVTAQAAGNTLYVNNALGSDPNCPTTTYSTIQTAVDAAADGDTIVVCASTYVESVNDTGKSLTFRGAQATVPANGRTGPESIVDGNSGTAFTLSGAGSSLDGFTLTGATGGNQTPAVLVRGTGESATSTIFTNNGQAAIIFGSGARFTHDLIEQPSGTNAGGFFFNSGGGANSTVSHTTFSGDLENAAVNVADNPPISGLSITNNVFNARSGGNFAVLGAPVTR